MGFVRVEISSPFLNSFLILIVLEFFYFLGNGKLDNSLHNLLNRVQSDDGSIKNRNWLFASDAVFLY